MYLLRLNKAYEIFPKENHDFVDKVAYESRKIFDDWSEMIEILEDLNHPVRGQKYKSKTRFEEFMDSLSPNEKKNLIEENNNENIEEILTKKELLRMKEKLTKKEKLMKKKKLTMKEKFQQKQKKNY